MFQPTPWKSKTNRLTDLEVRQFISDAHKTGQRGHKLSDGGSLHLRISPAGTALWQMKYTLGTQKTASLGRYPQVSLEEARRRRDAAQALVEEGHDPVLAKRLKRSTTIAANEQTFGRAYHEWVAERKKEWSPVYYRSASQSIERDVLPRLGKLPVKDITPALLAEVIKAISGRGALDTASKILQRCFGIFRHAQVQGWCQSNPAEPVKGVLPRRKWKGAMPAVLEFPGLGAILRDAEMARLSPAIKMAHRLAAFTATRMGNVTLAEWSEFHLEEEVPYWLIPRRKMKAQDRAHDHKVILCQPIVQELLAWRNATGGEGYVFPTPTSRRRTDHPISREAVEKAYRETLKLKDRHTPHGWRAAFSTLARENGHARDVVELALDHVHDTEVVRAYDRGHRMPDRVKLMTWWGEQLVAAQRGGDLVMFRTVNVA
jgi:integrase